MLRRLLLALAVMTSGVPVPAKPMPGAWLPAGPGAPGPKQVHLLGLGFRNPDLPGIYPVEVTIRPDPDSTATPFGHGAPSDRARERANHRGHEPRQRRPAAALSELALPDGACGRAPLQYGFLLWDRDGTALVGVDVAMTGPRLGRLVTSDGRHVGAVRIQAPSGAARFGFSTAGPSSPASAFLTGNPTGLLTARLEPDPEIAGDYVVTAALTGGNAVRLFVRVAGWKGRP